MKKAFFLLIAFLSFAAFAESLPKGYGGVELGMSLDSAKQALKSKSDFGYAGDRDVSLLPGDARVLIETDSRNMQKHGFLTQCWFQFYKENLYSIILNLNPERVDHYSVYTALVKKYGEPNDFSPERSVWKNDSVTMSLERPLTLKYTDNKTMDDLSQKSLVQKNGWEVTRQMFLDEL
ncbi:MAG: hypothetical protein J6V90_05895 [Treponema sp.]|nr:hypothetical protein [Treponema sp.]